MITAVDSYNMTLATWTLTGTLLSLNAVVIKQPKVRAAMTLRENANREFALDKTVFIFHQKSQTSKEIITNDLHELCTEASYWDGYRSEKLATIFTMNNELPFLCIFKIKRHI